MRILMISWEYPPHVVGGMGKHVADLAPTLGKQTVSDGPLFVDVVTTGFGGGPAEEQIDACVTVHRVDVPPVNPLDHYNSVVDSNSALVERAIKLAERQTYDLIHAHDWLVSRAAIQLKHRWKTPLVVTIHATERGRHQGHVPSDTSHQIDRLEWESCYEAWRVIVCSEFMRGEVQAYFGLPSEKVNVIPNGISIDALYRCPEEERERLRARYAPNGERLLFFVGRIVHEKGLHVLIRAMPRILADFPNTRLLVAGRNGEKYWPMAYELNVDKAIEFLGYVTDAERDCFFQIADGAVFPSIYEPFGIVALEAMANGCNVIASNVSGLTEVVHHKENGLTVYPENPMSIVWAVNQLFSDPAAAELQRRRALEEVKTIYNWQTIAAQTAALYEDIMNERRATEW